MTTPTEYRVATADGEGAGRFLALCLADAVNGGAALAAIVPSRPGSVARYIDFVFAHETGATHEVVRAHIGARCEVVQAELIRRRGAAPNGSFVPDEALIKALGSGDTLSRLDWDDDDVEGRKLRIDLYTSSRRVFELLVIDTSQSSIG